MKKTQPSKKRARSVFQGKNIGIVLILLLIVGGIYLLSIYKSGNFSLLGKRHVIEEIKQPAHDFSAAQKVVSSIEDDLKSSQKDIWITDDTKTSYYLYWENHEKLGISVNDAPTITIGVPSTGAESRAGNKMTEQIAKILQKRGFRKLDYGNEDFFSEIGRSQFERGTMKCITYTYEGYSPDYIPVTPSFKHVLVQVKCADNTDEVFAVYEPYLKAAIDYENKTYPTRGADFSQIVVNVRSNNKFFCLLHGDNSMCGKIIDNKPIIYFEGDAAGISCQEVDKLEIPAEIYGNCYTDPHYNELRFKE